MTHPDQCFGRCSHRYKNGVGCREPCAKDGTHTDQCRCSRHLTPDVARRKRKGPA